MGNNPVLHNAQIDKKEQPTDAITIQLREIRDAFMVKLYAAQKEHRERINEILRTIDERKIKDLKEKLKNI